MNAASTVDDRWSASRRPNYADAKRRTIDSFVAFGDGDQLPEWPLELFLEISNVCNLKCAMCSTFSALNPQRFIELKMADRGFIDTANVARSLEPLLQHVLNVHCFGYGEPTIHPDFRAFLSFIARYDVMIDFFTNGMHLAPDLCEFLVDKRVERVTVSFSGVTKEDYENVYLGGHYETVLRGIESLAAEKVRRGSRYPLIEINSLSFEHHVQKLDQFVDFMADRGVNVIYLKRLQTQFSIPTLAGHASIFRPWVEGEILARARRRAEERGLVLSMGQYLMTEVQSDAEWKRVKSTQGWSASSPPDEVSVAVVPIARFKQRVKDVQPVRPSAKQVAEDREIYHEVSPERLREFLGIRPPLSAGRPFYCLEPFKTMYVRRNGFVKPCCFANDRAPALGMTLGQDGGEIWRGARYQAVRAGILNHQYPDSSCSHCLKGKIGPQGHNSHAKIDAYLSWYRQTFGQELVSSPVARLKSRGDNTEIVERFLAKHPDRRLDGDPAASAPAPQVLRHPRAVRMLAERIQLCSQSGQALDGLVEGHLDSVTHDRISGWVWSPLFPNKRFDVAIYDFDTEIGCVTANRFRSDLLKAQKNDGRYAFTFRIPASLHDGNVHGFRARLLGTDFFLRSAPVMTPMPPVPPESDADEHRQREPKPTGLGKRKGPRG